jgi:signal transduction histidine kinase
MVNIYDMNNIISYSFDQAVIGKKDAGGTGYKNAVQGKSTSKLVQRGNFIEMLLGLPKESRLVTFAPLRAEKPLSRISGPVLGVVEIVQDLSEDDKAIFKFQMLIIITSSVVMGCLFLVLLFVVQRGERIFEKRAQERLRLEEQLSRAKHLSTLGEMVAGISHEIRNPLGIITSSAEHLKKKVTDTDPSSSFIDIISEEAGRLNNIITDFLNFARPREPELDMCKVDEVLEKNIRFLSTEFKEKGYTFNPAYHNSLPSIMADPDMLYQAFLNLFINAIQAMPEGGEIQIRVEPLNDTLFISIEDKGEGIPEEIIDKIWNPFFTSKDKGTGLGLGIVKNIIEAHNGQVAIENRQDKGAHVKIVLPLNQGD